jgi:DNA-binding TFAR19-related protein (PDSD5 family)
MVASHQGDDTQQCKQQYSKQTIMNQTLLPASERLNTVNLTKSRTK